MSSVGTFVKKIKVILMQGSRGTRCVTSSAICKVPTDVVENQYYLDPTLLGISYPTPPIGM